MPKCKSAEDLSSGARASVTKKSSFRLSLSSFSNHSAKEPSSVTRSRGCMKGTQNDQERNRKRRVRFISSRSPHIEYKIDPYFKYAADMWWTKSEMNEFKRQQADFTTQSPEIKYSAMSYLEVYAIAREQIFDQDQDHAFKPIMCADLFESLVVGRSKGFAGLEVFSKETRSRRKVVRQTVMMTLAAYYDFAGIYDKDKAARMLRSYSRSLTAPDRFWAVALGNADCSAAEDVLFESSLF